jgi:N-acetyl-anhydromuramyl-L-alanine amidase AmpD
MTRKIVEWKYALKLVAQALGIKVPDGYMTDTEAWGPAARELAKAVSLHLHLAPADGTLSLALKKVLRPHLFHIEQRLSLYNFTPYWRTARGIKFWVLHHTAFSGPAENVVAYFQSPTAQANAHYTVGKDGDIYQTCLDRHAGWHAGRGWFDWNHDGSISDEERQLNKHSIGVEINNTGSGRDPFPDLQVRATAWLVARKAKKYGIRRRNITDHKTVNKYDGKTDMASNWPWVKFWRYLDIYK